MTDLHLAAYDQPGNNGWCASQHDIVLPPRVRMILDEVCALHEVGIRELLSPARRRRITTARHAAMKRVRAEIVIQGAPASYHMMGHWFRRDHSTCVYAVMGYGPR